MISMLKTVVLMGTLATMTCGLMAAQSPTPNEPNPMPTAQLGRLTIEQLGKMLENLGYAPKSLKNKDGKVVGYNVEFKSDGWTIRFNVCLSIKGDSVWFDAGLATLTDLAGVRPQTLLSLLEQNDVIAPAYVYYYKERNNLRLSMPFDNYEVTAAKLRTKADFFAEAIKKIIMDYEKTTKPVQATPAGPAPIPGL